MSTCNYGFIMGLPAPAKRTLRQWGCPLVRAAVSTLGYACQSFLRPGRSRFYGLARRIDPRGVQPKSVAQITLTLLVWEGVGLLSKIRGAIPRRPMALATKYFENLYQASLFKIYS